MGVPSCCLCWLHNSGVSTPSVFSQSKNTLGLTLNQLDISFPRPNLKAIFSLFLSPYRIYTQTHTSPGATIALTSSAVCYEHPRYKPDKGASVCRAGTIFSLHAIKRSLRSQGLARKPVL